MEEGSLAGAGAGAGAGSCAGAGAGAGAGAEAGAGAGAGAGAEMSPCCGGKFSLISILLNILSCVHTTQEVGMSARTFVSPSEIFSYNFELC